MFKRFIAPGPLCFSAILIGLFSGVFLFGATVLDTQLVRLPVSEPARPASQPSPQPTRVPVYSVQPQPHQPAELPGKELQEARDQLKRDLTYGQADLVRLAAELTDSEPKDAEAAVTKIDVMLRARLDHQAAVAITQLKPLCKGYMDRHVDELIRDLFNSLIHTYRSDTYYSEEAALALIETFPERVGERTISLWSLQASNWQMQLITTPGQWDDDRIEQWQIEMHQRAVRDAMPDDYWRRHYGDRADLTWLKVRISHLSQLGRASQLLDELERDVREHPSDTRKVLNFLSVRSAITPKPDEEPVDCSWVADVFEPAHSTAAHDVAGRLFNMKQWSSAAKLLRFAIDTPVTADERSEITQMPQQQAMVSPDHGTVKDRAAVLEKLAMCLVKLGRLDEAKALADEVAEIRKQQPPSRYPSQYPHTAAASIEIATDPRAFEARIVAEEELSADDPQYWLRRVTSYQQINRSAANSANGANLPHDANSANEAEIERAYRKGLELAKPAPRLRGKARTGVRASLLRGYARFLQEKDRSQEAATLLLNELRTSPAGSESSAMAIALLKHVGYSTSRTSLFNGYLDADDPVLWQWLEKSKVWEDAETSLLGAMLSRLIPPETAPTDRSGYATRTGFAPLLESAVQPVAPSTMPYNAKSIKGAQQPQSQAGTIDAASKSRAFLAAHYFTKIERMARDADPSRALCYGRMLCYASRYGLASNSAGAIPWLRYAMEHEAINGPDATRYTYAGTLRRDVAMALYRAYVAANQIDEALEMLDANTDQNGRRNMTLELFNVYVARSDFQLANQILDDPENQIGSRKLFEDLAVKAAQENDPDTAICFWRRASNISLGDYTHSHMDRQLVELGLGKQIDEYYATVRAALPEFDYQRPMKR